MERDLPLKKALFGVLDCGAFVFGTFWGVLLGVQ